MTRNVAFPERVLRIAVGLGILGLFGALPSPWRWLALAGLLPLGTGLTGRCPIYAAARRGPRRGGGA